MAYSGDPRTWQPERLRDLLNSESRDGVEQQRALDALEQEMSARSAIGGLAALDRRRRRRDFDTHTREHEMAGGSESIHPHSSPSAILRARRRALRPSQRVSRHRDSYNDVTRPEQSDSITNPRRPTPPFGYSEAFTDHYLSPYHHERDHHYRAKRRKLDDGTFDDESKIVAYGDKGRVTPGPLKMEIVSCDGGEYDDPPKGMTQHVLQDDASVYSTKSNRCNMLLKHAGGTPFSLTKIVFKAPRDGYDAPVQEGMIFIAMDDDSLLEKTSQYEVRYAPKSYRHHHQRRYDSYRPSLEYMNSTRPPLRSIDHSRYMRAPLFNHPWLHYGESLPELETVVVPGFDVSFGDPSDGEDLPPRSPLSPYRWHDDAPSRTGRAYTDRYRPIYADELSYVDLSATSDDSEDEETTFRPPLVAADNQSLVERLTQRQIHLRAAAQRSDSEGQNSQPRTRSSPDEWQDLNQIASPQRSAFARTGSGNAAPSERPTTSACPQSSDTAKVSTEHNPTSDRQSVRSNTLAPHARFFIHRHKSSIAVNFDPPVSGRYILVKLWAACPNANIDIQSIIVHGYGGPRFFPAQEFR